MGQKYYKATVILWAKDGQPLAIDRLRSYTRHINMTALTLEPVWEDRGTNSETTQDHRH